MMDDNLISKKELLDLMNISYGQLYRWKRKELIPEDWFIKKSSFTGQETFFPRDKVIDRIKKIKNMKDDASLDDLADLFSNKVAEIKLNYENLLNQNIVTNETLTVCKELLPKTYELSFEDVLYMYICDKFLLSGNISLEESKTLFNSLTKNYINFNNEDFDVIFIRKMGVGFCILCSTKNKFYIEESAKVIMNLNVDKCVEELKLKLK